MVDERTDKPGDGALVEQMEMEWNAGDGGAGDAAGDTAGDLESPARAAWGGKLEFILTCIGFAVGLGNVWRFPYLCYKNGGGAFLIPYLLMLALVGVPIFFMEISFGQFASRGPIAIWTVNPLFKGLGCTMIISNTLVAIYYNVIIAWCIKYFLVSMTTTLPWISCDNAWNTPACRADNDSVSGNVSGFGDHSTYNSTLNFTQLKTPSEEFFYREILNISSGISELGEVRWPLAACLGAAWIIIFAVLIKGISSLGKVVYFSSLFPYLLLTVMLIRGVTLPGAVDGILFYITPDFARLTDAQVWSDAAVQIFYSLSTCTGGLVALASYNKFHNNCLRDSLLVPIINCGTSLFAGFVIFSVLGFMAHQKGVSVADVAASGPGLVFVVYPEGLAQMPIAPIWSVMFFFMMITLGFSSMFSMVESTFAAITDELAGMLSKGRRDMFFRGGCCFIFWLIGVTMTTRGGFYLFFLVDNYVGGFPLLVTGLLEAIVLQHVYGFSRFSSDVALMLGKKPNIYFKITWIVVTPAILLSIIIFKAAQQERLSLFHDYMYPDWAMVLAWALVIVPLTFIPGMYMYRFMKEGGYQLTLDLLSPTEAWGPALKEDRLGIYAAPTVDLKVNVLRSVSNTYDNVACDVTEVELAEDNDTVVVVRDS